MLVARLLLFALLLFPLIAGAQPGPLLVIEHDWRLISGTNSYGLLQTTVKGDPTHWTGVYCGKYLFALKLRIFELFALILLPVGVLAAVLLAGHTRKTRSPSIH